MPGEAGFARTAKQIKIAVAKENRRQKRFDDAKGMPGLPLKDVKQLDEDKSIGGLLFNWWIVV